MTAVTSPPGPPAFHTLSVSEALATEKVDQQRGLGTAEAETRRKTFGANRFAEGKKEPHVGENLLEYAQICLVPLRIAAVQFTSEC